MNYQQKNNYHSTANKTARKMAHAQPFLHSSSSKLASAAAFALVLFVARTLKRRRAAADSMPGKTGRQSTSRRVGVDAEFISQMKKLLPICVPGVLSREAGLLASLACVLVARTWLDIWFSGFNGAVVKAIVSRNRKWPLSIVNNSLKLCISSLALSFRTRLTKHAHEQYLKGITFYKVSNIDNRIQNADQLLTQDIDKFAESLSHLYSDIAKPLVDICLFAYKLGQAIGKEAPFFMIGYFLFSGTVLRALSPPFGKYTAQEQKLEGDFRFTHSRIITHSEEIAFYGGGQREKTLVNKSFEQIRRHILRIIRMRFANGIIDSVFVKYLATMLAYYLLARPVFNPRYTTPFMGTATEDPTKIMEDYSRNSGYLVNLSQAVGRIILAGRDLTRFAGFTSRVAELFDVLEDINQGRYERTMVAQSEGDQSKSTRVSPSDLKGRVHLQDGVIEFIKVPIVTPNGDRLVDELNLKVTSGMNCLITGPNGCGKSSLFRILGDLWPLFGGTVTKPAPEHLFYVPQKPYLALGSLRDQVIYPHTQQQALSRGFTDDKIMELLDLVYLAYLVEREGSFDAVQDWADVLSGGEKQRVAMARLFYHKPQFAILDECTSAVSVDVEGLMYGHAKRLGITLFTVSHRTSLFKYHEYLLRFDGEGHYQFRRLEEEDSNTPFAFSHGKSKHDKKHSKSNKRSASTSDSGGRESDVDANTVL